MKKLYQAPKSENVKLDPLMVAFLDSNNVSVTDQVYDGPVD